MAAKLFEEVRGRQVSDSTAQIGSDLSNIALVAICCLYFLARRKIQKGFPRETPIMFAELQLY